MTSETKALVAGILCWFLAAGCVESAFDSGDFRFLILFSILGALSVALAVFHSTKEM